MLNERRLGYKVFSRTSDFDNRTFSRYDNELISGDLDELRFQ